MEKEIEPTVVNYLKKPINMKEEIEPTAVKLF